MRDLAELNINDGGERVTRLPPSDSVIAEFERECGLKLPGQLLKLLRHSNGGHPELDSYDPDGIDSPNSFGVDKLFHLSDEKDSPYSLWEAIRVWRPYIGDNALPFAEDGGGNIAFLDLSANPAPVRVCWHDENFRTGFLAQSFEMFIDGLTLDPDYI